jgi:SAM-dependent methyltransferase
MKRYTFDLDGTLCTSEQGRYVLAQPFVDRIAKVRALYESGDAYIIIDTARGTMTGDWREATAIQLAQWSVPYHELRCGMKPFAHVYVGDEAVSADDFFAEASGHADRWPDEYFAQRVGNDPRRQRAFEQERAFLAWHGVWGSGAVCDIGAATGEFLDALDWQGRRYGTEINAYARRIAETRRIDFSRNIFTESSYFDVVTMRGVVQHLPEPFRYLHRSFRALKPGGHLAILATPDTSSFYYRVFGEFPPPLSDDARNYWMPSAPMLSNALRNVGFEIVAVEHPYWGGPYARPVHDVVSFARRLILRQRVSCSWPGNLFNLIARKPA